MSDRGRLRFLRWMLGVSIALIAAGVIGTIVFSPSFGILAPTATGALLAIGFGLELRGQKRGRGDSDGGAS